MLTTDNAILYGMAKQDSNYEVVGKIFTDEPYGIAVQKGADDLTKEINTLIKDMKASGSMTNYMRSGLDKTRKVDSKSERMRVLILFL